MAIDDVGQIHDPADIIVVPDLSPFELVALARKRLQPTRFDPEFLGWNFIRGSSGRVVEVRTRCFEVVTWTPKRRVETPEIIDQFGWLGADGNTRGVSFVDYAKEALWLFCDDPIEGLLLSRSCFEIGQDLHPVLLQRCRELSAYAR